MITITALELKDLLSKWPGMPLLNVRPVETATESQLPGSLRVPLTEFEQRVPVLFPDKDAGIVVYGLNFTCEASTKAADMLEKLGYKNIYNFSAGVKGWLDEGFPLQRGN